MNATDLHTLVAGVPEVVPEPLTFLEEVGHWVWACDYIDPLHAADLICAEAKRRMKLLSVVRHDDGRSSDAYTAYTRTEQGTGPTELEAVLAAYAASKAPGSHGEATEPRQGAEGRG